MDVGAIRYWIGDAKERQSSIWRIWNNNDDIYGYKWRNWKMHLVALENMNSEPQPLNVPRIYNLITDPKEEYNMASEATWLAPVMFKKIVEFQKTLMEEPPIQLGTPDPYNPQK